MPNNPNIDNHAKQAFTVGILLVGIVLVATLGRDYWNQKNNQNVEKSVAKNALENQNKITEKKISINDALQIIRSQNSDFSIIDLRDQESFQKEHILNSKNINPNQLTDSLGMFNKKTKYILVDENGSSAAPMVIMNLFSPQGYDNVTYLEGGFSAWKSGFAPTISVGDPYSLSDQAKVSYVKSDDLKKMLDGNVKIFIIDVRTLTGFADGHIKDATNIPLSDLESKKNTFPIGAKIILYDNDGLWAFQGAVRLFDAGVLNVSALSDGLDAWKQKGFEVVK